jgi:hypothetical protein
MSSAAFDRLIQIMSHKLVELFWLDETHVTGARGPSTWLAVGHLPPIIRVVPTWRISEDYKPQQLSTLGTQEQS